MAATDELIFNWVNISFMLSLARFYGMCSFQTKQKWFYKLSKIITAYFFFKNRTFIRKCGVNGCLVTKYIYNLKSKVFFILK